MGCDLAGAGRAFVPAALTSVPRSSQSAIAAAGPPGTQTVLLQSTPMASFFPVEKFRGQVKRYGRGSEGVPSCLKNRLERLWCGRMYWVAPGSLRGGISVREGRRDAGKCDKLSFLWVFLSQMDSVLGATYGYALWGRGRVARLLTQASL